jgi:hypothetical protein
MKLNKPLILFVMDGYICSFITHSYLCIYFHFYLFNSIQKPWSVNIDSICLPLSYVISIRLLFERFKHLATLYPSSSLIRFECELGLQFSLILFLIICLNLFEGTKRKSIS